MKISIVILAAGQGKRMHSTLPKVLHPLAGIPLLQHVVESAKTIEPQAIYVVYGYAGELVREQLNHLPVEWVLQEEPSGTGHAVSKAISFIPNDHYVLVLLGDVPLLSTETLQNIISHTEQDKAMGLLTAYVNDPTGLGRILRSESGDVLGIVEHKDASPDQLAINEINTGVMLIKASHLKSWLTELSADNAQKEFYLTDILESARKEKIQINAVVVRSAEEAMGVNTRSQLALLERTYQHQQAEKLMQAGVSITDPLRFDLRGQLSAGNDVVIEPNVMMEGNVVMGSNCKIEPNVILRDVILGDNVWVKANSIIESADIAEDCEIGPFARIRPETTLLKGSRIGNFVEVKKSVVGENSKINHLSYIGDADIGEAVNIGAGTITCNYDGISKHKTTIADNVFIGSGTELIAPVNIEKGATVGAGSTITKTVPAGELGIARVNQKNISGWTHSSKSIEED